MEPSIEESNIIEEDYDEKLKIMIIGDSNVEKTSLIIKYFKNKFHETYMTTIGIDFQIKFLNINNKKN